MATEVIASLSEISTRAGSGASGSVVSARSGFSLSELGGFQFAMAQAEQARQQQSQAAGLRALEGFMRPLEVIDNEAASLGADARAINASDVEMSPSEMVTFSMRCHEYMFHCQLTSNAANRTSDGLQQLFRQQG